MKKALTALLIDSLKPQKVAYYIGDSKQDGLRVRVAPDGNCTWNVTARIKGGVLLSTSLGRCDTEGRNGLDLSSARDRAAAIVKAARQGENLIATERAAREVREQAITTAALISAYSSDISNPHRKGGALRTAKEIQRRLERALVQKIGGPAQDVTRRDVSDMLDAVASKFPREAEKRRQTIDVMFNWAVAKGYVVANPAAGLPSFGSGALRDRVLSSDELRKLWFWLDAGADEMPLDVVRVIRLQLLTGARVGEIAGIVASEISWDKQKLLWTLPADRSKNKKSHMRPLVGRARHIIEGVLESKPDGGLFQVIDRSRSLRSDDIGLALNHRERPIDHFTTHDLRRTVVSGLDELGVPLDTIAAVIGHRRGGAETRTLIRHYSRPNLDSRIEEALIRWDNHLTHVLQS